MPIPNGSFCLHCSEKSAMALKGLGKEAPLLFLCLSSSWPTLISGAVEAGENAAEGDDNSGLLRNLMATNITQWDLK